MRSNLLLSGLALLSFVNPPMAAADPQVALSHSPAIVTLVPDGVTFDLEVRAENRENEPVHGLTLSFVPQHHAAPSGGNLHIGSLGPHESRSLPFRFVVPVASSVDRPVITDLYWGVVYLDAGGRRMEFLCASREGG